MIWSAFLFVSLFIFSIVSAQVEAVDDSSAQKEKSYRIVDTHFMETPITKREFEHF